MLVLPMCRFSSGQATLTGCGRVLLAKKNTEIGEAKQKRGKKNFKYLAFCVHDADPAAHHSAGGHACASPMGRGGQRRHGAACSGTPLFV